MEEQIKSVKQSGETRESLLAAFLEECYVVDFLQEYAPNLQRTALRRNMEKLLTGTARIW